MCIMSAVTDYYRQNIWSSPLDATISWDAYTTYLDMKTIAAKIDDEQHQADCAKPEIVEWEAEVKKKAEEWRAQNP